MHTNVLKDFACFYLGQQKEKNYKKENIKLKWMPYFLDKNILVAE